MQEKLEATAAAVEQERAAMKRIEVANSMLASLVEYQQAMQEALEAASEVGGGCGVGRAWWRGELGHCGRAGGRAHGAAGSGA